MSKKDKVKKEQMNTTILFIVSDYTRARVVIDPPTLSFFVFVRWKASLPFFGTPRKALRTFPLAGESRISLYICSFWRRRVSGVFARVERKPSPPSYIQSVNTYSHLAVESRTFGEANKLRNFSYGSHRSLLRRSVVSFLCIGFSV